MNEELGGTGNAAADNTSSAGAGTFVAGMYKVVASSLNVRSKLLLSDEIVTNYDKGQYIFSIVADTVTADGYV